MTCELGSEVVCHPITTFTTQQNDNDILSALLRTSLLRSTCPVVHTDVLRTISATQQANSLRNVVTLAPPSRDFFAFRRISAVCPPPMTDGRRRHPIRPSEGRTGQGRAPLQLPAAVVVTLLLLLLAALLNALTFALLRPALLA